MPDSQKVKVERAIRRGLEFMYRSACDPDYFETYGHDFLFCFHAIASTSKDDWLKKLARAMGRERARAWRREHSEVAADVDADDVFQLACGGDAADRLGVRDPAFKPQVRRAAARFTSRDYFCFDTTNEAPPDDVPENCECGANNRRGRTVCRRCRQPLGRLGRYGVWMDALIRTYIGERYGVTLGAPYADALQWLPTMRPYRGYENGDNPDYYWTVYAVTHVVYTLNDYSVYNLSPRWLPQEFDYLRENVKVNIELGDPETVGELLDTLKSFGLKSTHPLVREGVNYILSQQNPDGSWGETEEEDIYRRYHPTFTAVDGLREYAWRGEGLRFPKLKPRLLEWARQT